jgi:hypothetical protein
MIFSKKIKASVTVIVLRILSSFLIYAQPLLGIGIYMLFDAYDTLLLEDIGGMTYSEYERIDKIIDSLTFLILLPLGLKYGNFIVLAVLLVLRIIGTALFIFRKKEYYLILFPNFFISYLFLAIFLKEMGFGSGFGFPLLVLLILFQLSLELLYHYVYPHFLHDGILRKTLSLLGYNSKRRV